MVAVLFSLLLFVKQFLHLILSLGYEHFQIGCETRWLFKKYPSLQQQLNISSINHDIYFNKWVKTAFFLDAKITCKTYY